MTRRFSLRMRDHIHAPDTKRDYTEQLFTEVAPKYAFITRVLSFGRDQVWKDRMIGMLPPREAPLCVDLACGPGDLTRRLAERYADGEILGIDLTEPMLERARERNRYAHVRFEEADMCRTGVADACVDIVTGGYALRNAPDLGEAFEEVGRILKPDGVAAFLDFSRPANPWLCRLEYALLRLWGGFWGILLHRNTEVYTYIAASLATFPDRKALRALARRKGLEVVESRLFFFGVMELVFLRKAGP